MNDQTWMAFALLWSLPWKGYALWKAARNKQWAWYISIFLLQTVAILEMIYLAFFQRDKN
ncbi:DUF5652 family protein [Candidatus Margulisiibacteriota bacterium]